MKKILLKIYNRIIRYIFASSFDDFKIFIKNAVDFGYRIEVKEIFYPNYFNNSTDNSCIPFQGGTYYLKLRGIKRSHYDITCTVMLGRFEPLSSLEIDKSREEILNRLDSLNLSKFYI
jgi:hypothetical protein